MADDPEVRFTDDPDAAAWRYDRAAHLLTLSRPKAREQLGSETSDPVIAMLGLSDWRDSGLGG
jgi:phage baseplate assembly protein gpV